MGNEEQLKIVIEARNKAKKAFDDADRQLKALGATSTSMGEKFQAAGKKMQSVGKMMTIGVTLPILAIGAAAAKSLIRIEQIGAQTDAVLKSTGNAANTTRAQIDAMAGKLEELTGAEAESTTIGANMLLTFTNIKNGVGKGNNIFDQATKTMLDMGTAMNGGVVPAGEQLKGTAIQLGKALNDPIKGVTALTKVGVTFTQGQKDQIKTMVEAGDTLGAQKLILAELNKEFGGSAEAFGQTTAGKIAILKHRFGTVTEELTANLLPTIIKIVDKVSGMMAAFSKLSAGQKKFILIAVGVAAVLGPILSIVGTLIPIIAAASLSVTLIVAGIALLAAGLVYAYFKFDAFRKIVDTVFKAVVVVIKWAWGNVIKPIWDLMVWYITNAIIPGWKLIFKYAKQAWDIISSAIKSAWENVIKPIWDLIYWYITNVTIPIFKKIWDVVKVVWNAITAYISWAWKNVIQPIWNLIWAYITNVLVPVWKTIWTVIKTVWTAIVTVLKWAWENNIKPVWNLIWSYITNVLVPTFKIIWSTVKTVFETVVSIIKGAWDKVKTAFDTVKGWIASLVDKFVSIKDKVSSAFSSIANAIKAPFKIAFNAVAKMWNSTIGKIGFTTPKWLGPLGGKKFSVPKIPTLYTGARDFGGLAVVGDVRGQGGEIINMPRGSDVFSNSESKQILRNLASGNTGQGGGTINTFTGNIYLMNADAVKEFFKQLDRQAELQSMGISA